MKAIDKAIKLCDAAITGKGINAFVSALAKKGYEIDSADRRDPKGFITLLRRGSEYTAEVTKYSDGTYELQEYNIRKVK